MFTWLTAKLYGVGAAVLIVLAAIGRMQMLKNARDNARKERDALKARVHVNRVNKMIKKEEKKELFSRREELKKELSKEGKDFEGVKNFTDPNDF